MMASPSAVAESQALPTRTLDHCLACGGAVLRALPLRYEHRGVSFPLAECRRCGMRFLAVQPTADGLAELYAPAYFESDFRCGRSERSYYDESAYLHENRALVDAFETVIHDQQGRRLLEVGCAGGWLLKHARERGWQVQGVELSAEAVAHARGLGLDVVHGDLPGARLADAQVDLVYMGDVLEHVPDCREVVAEVARVLRPGGFFYLRGPITTHSLARGLALALYGLAGGTLVLREPPYHLWEFTPDSLARLMESEGMRVVRMRQSKIPPGRPHGEKKPWERAVMAAIDTANVPLTSVFNARGDRIVMVARHQGTSPISR